MRGKISGKTPPPYDHTRSSAGGQNQNLSASKGDGSKSSLDGKQNGHDSISLGAATDGIWNEASFTLF